MLTTSQGMRQPYERGHCGAKITPHRDTPHTPQNFAVGGEQHSRQTEPPPQDNNHETLPQNAATNDERTMKGRNDERRTNDERTTNERTNERRKNERTNGGGQRRRCGWPTLCGLSKSHMSLIWDLKHPQRHTTVMVHRNTIKLLLRDPHHPHIAATLGASDPLTR